MGPGGGTCENSKYLSQRRYTSCPGSCRFPAEARSQGQGDVSPTMSASLRARQECAEELAQGLRRHLRKAEERERRRDSQIIIPRDIALTSAPSRLPALGDPDKPENFCRRGGWGCGSGEGLCQAPRSPLHHTADRHLRTFLPKPVSCWFRAKCAAFPPGSVRKWPGLDSNRLLCFPNQASVQFTEPQQCPFSRVPLLPCLPLPPLRIHHLVSVRLLLLV